MAPPRKPRRSRPPAKSQSDDVVFVHSPTDDGEGVRVLRARGERIEAGEVRPLKDGAPITGDVVKLKPREESPRLFDVETELAHEARSSAADAPTRSGPPQVATDEYRRGWARTFPAKKRTLH